MPEQKERHRSERTHIGGNFQIIDEVKLKGLRVFDHHNSTKGIEHRVERDMQRKIRIDGLEGQRNKISSAALGDKAYKYPEYSSHFYESGGLIPGSTINPRIKKSNFNSKIGSVLTKPNWDVKVKLDEIQ